MQGMEMTKPEPCLDGIRHALDVLFDPEQIVELRALFSKGRRRVDAGYFDDDHRDHLAREAMRLNREGAAVYVTLNVIDPQLLGRYCNRVEQYASATATDGNVVWRRWLLLDFDPVRPKDTSATNEQLAAANTSASSCGKVLREAGWPEPIVSMSGNGYHLLYRIDLPNTDESTALVKGSLQTLAARVGTDTVKLDLSVFNAARIVKLPGTVANKGDHAAATPWRVSELVKVPEAIRMVGAEQLQALTPFKPQEAQRNNRTGTYHNAFDLDAFLSRLGLEYTADTHDGRERFKLKHCPFNPEHGFGESAIFREPSGRLGFKCQHSSCANQGWRELRALIDGPRERRKESEKSAESVLQDTDIANARRLVRRHGCAIRFTPERGWLFWDGRRWVVDDLNQVAGLAKETACSIFDDLRQAGDDQSVLFNWARRSQSAERIRAMLYLAQSEPGIPMRWTDLDIDPWLLNCANGTVDLRLRASTLRPHRREDRLSRIVPINYDPDAACPQWQAFLERIIPTAAVREYVQRAVGYSLTGHTGEQCLFFAYGRGANGKTVLFEIVTALTGEYTVAANIETFTVQRQRGIPNDIARLAGARVVTVSETEDGQRLREALIKDLTGGDTITARFLNREFFDFRPRFKLWIRGNHKPQIRGTDDGIWRRIQLIPFVVTIPPSERDPSLLDKLRLELPGILSWAVRGCKEWQQNRLKPPQAVTAATTEYREDMDILGAFIAERCVIESAATVRAGELHKAYQHWCEEVRHSPMSLKRFGLAISERGFAKDEDKRGVYYLGIGLSVDSADSDGPFSRLAPIRARIEKNTEKSSPTVNPPPSQGGDEVVEGRL